MSELFRQNLERLETPIECLMTTESAAFVFNSKRRVEIVSSEDCRVTVNPVSNHLLPSRKLALQATRRLVIGQILATTRLEWAIDPNNLLMVNGDGDFVG